LFERFPQWHDRIERLLEVHAAIGAPDDVAAGVARHTPTSVPSTLLPGRTSPASGSGASAQIAQYDLLEQVGRGGMGVVYKARQRGLGRIVAIKLIRYGPHASREELARFRAEAEAAARLQHPNIAQIFDVGEQDACPFLSMEFIDGGSLEEKVGDKSLPAQTAARMVAQLAAAIHYAHQRGIVHRDLKPANVLLAQSDRSDAIELVQGPSDSGRFDLKISDFGLAKRLPVGAATNAAGGNGRGLTETGAVLGTPSYMAPEQAGGKTHEIGPRTDVYALGAILYKLLTGRPPFQSDTPLDTLEQVRSHEPVPPSRLRHKLPRDLETICLKCLAKEPPRRYASAGEVAAELERFLAGESIRARPVGIVGRTSRWCRRKPLVAGLLGVLMVVSCAGLAGIVWQWQRVEEHLRVAQRQRDEIARERAEAQRQSKRATANLQRAREAVDRLTGLGQQMGSWAGAGEARFQALEDALGFYEGLLQEQATDPAVRFETGRAHNRIGDILIEMGKWQAASEHYEKGVAIFAKLIGESPEQHDYRVYLAKCHLGAGHAAKWDRRPEAADASYRASAALWEELCRASPGDVGLTIGLSNTLMNHAGVLLGLGRLDEAQRANARTLTLQHGLLIRSEPTAVDGIEQIIADVMKVVSEARDIPRQLSRRERWVLSEMALCIEGWSVLLQKQSNREAALDYCGKTMAIRELLVAQEPNVPYHANFLARSHLRLASFLTRTGARDEEEQCYRRVISLLEKPAADFPDRYEYSQQLVDARVRLARLLIKTDRLDEAEAHLMTAVQGEDRMAAAIPRGSPPRGQIKFRLELAAVQLQLGHLPQASESLQRAFELGALFIRDIPEQSKFARDLLDNASATYAVLLLLDGRDAAYRQHCAWTLEQLGQVSPAYANNTAWTCVLGPDAVPDLNAVVALAEQAVADASTEARRANGLNTLGAALYRADRFDECIETLAQSIAGHGQGGSPHDWVFLAMAHARSDHSAEAREWLDKVSHWCDQYASVKSSSATPSMKTILEFRLLLAEAAAVVRAR
jgi:serine/threonine protein kinase/tetratricopeptide (TPR) repeat protein